MMIVTSRQERQRVNEARSQIQKGIDYMDAEFPGWRDKIDLDTLDIQQADRCVCGQALRDEAKKRGVTGYTYVSEIIHSRPGVYHNMVDYGFAGADYVLLNREWRKALAK